MHQAGRRGEFVVMPGEELFLVVVIRSPGQHGGDIQILPANLPVHVARKHAFRGVLIVRATSRVNMVIARKPTEFGWIDPAFWAESEFGRTSRDLLRPHWCASQTPGHPYTQWCSTRPADPAFLRLNDRPAAGKRSRGPSVSVDSDTSDSGDPVQRTMQLPGYRFHPGFEELCDVREGR